MDLYKTNIYSDGSFGIPINLGKGINSNSDDFGLILRENGEGLLAYFSSYRPGGRGNDDIYGFKAKEALGLKTFSLKGEVINLKSKQSIAKVQVKLIGGDGTVLKEVYSDDDGKYRVEIPWRNRITIEATKDRYSIFSVTYNAEEYDSVEKAPFNMELSFIDDLLTEKEGKKVVKIRKFYFETDKANITPKIKIELDIVVDAALRFPQLKLSIESHTNSKGSNKNNKLLSQRRADAIKAYLTTKGVLESNMNATGFGEDNLINNCADGVYCLEFLHNQNERTHIVIANFDEL